MHRSMRLGVLVLVLTGTPAALAGGQTWPRMVRETATAMPDSVRLRMLAMIAQGDISGAVEYYLLATGATTAPRWLAAMQRAFDVVNRRAGPCQEVADDVLEGFKRLGQNPAYVRFANQLQNNRYIGFEMTPGVPASTLQVSTNASHVAVRVGERIYDAFTGPAGLVVKDYLARLINGRMVD